MSDQQRLDALAGRITSSLLNRSHLLPPGDIAQALHEAAEPLGVLAVRIYLADLQQRQLRVLRGSSGHGPETMSVDTTIAGRAYRSIKTQYGWADEERGIHRVWVPLIDGTERLGVLELDVRDIGDALMRWYRTFASMVGIMCVSKSTYSDTFAQTRRSQEMALQAELVWAFLPPRTFATDDVVITATLEPAYDVGGDAFDYSLLGDHLHASIFDATGHDLPAGLLTSVATASCRSTRRAGGSLPDVVARADHAIRAEFTGNRFVTAVVCDLNVATGEFSWIPCGHPPPLLIRGGKVVKELNRRQQLPLGLAEIDMIRRRQPRDLEPVAEAAPVYTERLERRDRILLYTDGITEGRAADGSPFGVERLSDFIIRHADDGTPAPEVLRRLNHAILDHQHGRLADDATIVMIEWRPDHPFEMLTP